MATLTALLQGIGPNIVTLAGARLVGLAPDLAVSGAARRSAALALVVLAAALLVERVAAAVAPVTFAYLSFSFTSALDRIRLAGSSELPGLEHFESPSLADRMEAGDWSKTGAPELLAKLITMLRRGTMLVGALLIVARMGWWIPLLVSLAAVAIGLNDWRHAGRQAELQRPRATELRFSDYHRELAVEPRTAREVRLLGIGDWLARRQWTTWSTATGPLFADLRRQLRENTIINAVRVVTLAVPVLFAVNGLRSGALPPEDFTAVVLALRTASNGMFVLEGIPGQLRSSAAFLPEAFAPADLPRKDPRMEVAGSSVPPRHIADGIRFEDVTFAYPGTRQAVLDRLNLHIRAGESLAVVGVNGAGKSTLVKLLCRFYDPLSGRITLDGTDLRDLDLVELRRRFAVIFQEFTRLPMSVADNVGLADMTTEHAADLALEHAARQAGAEKFINSLPDNWRTVLSREFGGVDLSSGQWQRLALARLLARRDAVEAPILVLDEPTAALDVMVEADLYERFAEITRGATTLLISHRFSTVRMADRVAVLEDGAIVEQGYHDELMSLQGRYAELFDLQARRFRPRRSASE